MLEKGALQSFWGEIQYKVVVGFFLSLLLIIIRCSLAVTDWDFSLRLQW